MTSVDTNVSNYTLSELLTIVDINNEELDQDEIIRKTNQFISRSIRKKHRPKPKMVGYTRRLYR